MKFPRKYATTFFKNIKIANRKPALINETVKLNFIVPDSTKRKKKSLDS